MLRKSDFHDLAKALGKRDSFARNSAWMFTSSGVSILIQFAFFPILSRIYSPEIYGVFGVFNAYTTVLGNAVSIGYNQAFVLPKSTRKFSALLRLTVWITCSLSVLSALYFWIAGEWTFEQLNHSKVRPYAVWIAPVVLLMALDRITGDWAIRNKEFKKQTVWSTAITAVTKSFNVGYGTWIAPTVSGLILTTVLQHGLRVWAYLQFVITDTKERWADKISSHEMKEVAKEYEDFPKYIHWGNVVNIFSNSLPAAALPLFGLAYDYVGFYTYSLLVLDLPVRLLGSGISSVFLQKSAELARERKHELAMHTWRLFKPVVLFSWIVLLGVMLFGETTYAWAFGEEWRLAGYAAELLAIGYFFRMISSPLTALFNTLRKERAYFIFQIILLLLRASSLLVFPLLNADFIEWIMVFSAANALAYIILCVWIFHLVGEFKWKVLMLSLSSGALALLIYYFVHL